MLKDFLYLREKNLKDVIELLLKSYTSSFSDSEQTLKRNSLGKAHHRLVILVDNKPGIRVTEILNCLKITKQSLNRIIQDLIKKNLISLEKGEKDGREKKIYLTKYIHHIYMNKIGFYDHYSRYDYLLNLNQDFLQSI